MVEVDVDDPAADFPVDHGEYTGKRQDLATRKCCAGAVVVVVVGHGRHGEEKGEKDEQRAHRQSLPWPN